MAHGNIDWESRTIRKPDRPLVEWARLGSLGNPSCTVGVLRNGSWVVDTADGLADLEDNRALSFVFPLLQLSVDEVIECLKLGLKKINLDQEMASTFPFVRLVVHALNSGGYWAEQSFGWLQVLLFGGDERTIIIEGLKKIESHKDFSQHLRQEARKARNRFERKS